MQDGTVEAFVVEPFYICRRDETDSVIDEIFKLTEVSDFTLCTYIRNPCRVGIRVCVLGFKETVRKEKLKPS